MKFWIILILVVVFLLFIGLAIFLVIRLTKKKAPEEEINNPSDESESTQPPSQPPPSSEDQLCPARAPFENCVFLNLGETRYPIYPFSGAIFELNDGGYVIPNPNLNPSSPIIVAGFPKASWSYSTFNDNPGILVASADSFEDINYLVSQTILFLLDNNLTRARIIEITSEYENTLTSNQFLFDGYQFIAFSNTSISYALRISRGLPANGITSAGFYFEQYDGPYGIEPLNPDSIPGYFQVKII